MARTTRVECAGCNDDHIPPKKCRKDSSPGSKQRSAVGWSMCDLDIVAQLQGSASLASCANGGQVVVPIGVSDEAVLMMRA